MTAAEQRAELHRQIWSIADDVRGSIDGWDFKQYILGVLFYRYISEDLANYMGGGNQQLFENAHDEDFSSEQIEGIINAKGFFIYPSQLFANVVKNAESNENLNTDLNDIFRSIENSAVGHDSEGDLRGLFADFSTSNERLGNSVKERNKRLAAILKGIAELNFNNFERSQIDVFGDAYEFLISNYAANAGKSGGEYFTPQQVSKLVAKLATQAQHNNLDIKKIYDPACGSGSLLLQAKKLLGQNAYDLHYYGQEINYTTYNLARMNMFLHGINYNQFTIEYGDTLLDSKFPDSKFDAIVSNPPYSVKWVGSDDPTLINDPRFAPAGVLAPKGNADFAFVLDALHHLNSQGRAAIVCFPGVFYRGGAERKIRQYLIDSNYVEAVIAMAPNLFFGTTIAVNILVLAKNKADNRTQFIDASELFDKQTKNNYLSDEHIEQIMNAVRDKQEIEHFSTLVSHEAIEENDYNLAVSQYLEARNTCEDIDIVMLNAELKATVEQIEHLRKRIDKVVSKIEGQ
ncbi:type I restriction-modification system subunit M [Brackiella oedipodis]|uniref:type I restriction-modification system subunit M n=1 Tax=Brackiella oedipodis TaxID=124225 RepID=UPI000490ACA0|nr:type I restriction-modification system subunit M [Brackiella oedipodis]